MIPYTQPYIANFFLPSSKNNRKKSQKEYLEMESQQPAKVGMVPQYFCGLLPLHLLTHTHTHVPQSCMCHTSHINDYSISQHAWTLLHYNLLIGSMHCRINTAHTTSSLSHTPQSTPSMFSSNKQLHVFTMRTDFVSLMNTTDSLVNTKYTIQEYIFNS